jgi:prevent-host-death family protein
MNIQLKDDIKSLSLLRTDPASVLRQVREEQRPVVITERGRPSAVLVDVDDYERQQEKLELMESILEGEQDIQLGKVESLDQVFQKTRKWFAKK